MSTTHLTSTLSLHDALPIFCSLGRRSRPSAVRRRLGRPLHLSMFAFHLFHRYSAIQSRCWLFGTSCGSLHSPSTDRKSTRLNSSHMSISYAVFCLKTKNEII